MSTNSNGLSKHLQVVTQAPPPIPHQNPPSTLMQIKVSPGNPPWSETVVVTPEQAEYWLQANTFNRDHRKSRVKSYARDMANGNWLFNTQGIEFATDGSLINGQHRLMAIVQSGVAIPMVVWFNVPPKTRSVIDLVGPRNLSDIARLTKLQAAVTQAMMRGMRGYGSVPTMAERQEFYNRFASHIDWTIAQFPSHIRGIRQANVLAAIARASMHIEDADIQHFCEVLRTGVPGDSARDLTILKLRDRLLQGAHPGGTTASKEIYALTASALRAFGEGRAISKLYAASTEPFPLPEASSE